MVIVWYAAHDVPRIRLVDANVLGGFHQLHRPRIDALTGFVANLCDPVPWVAFAAVPIVVALARGRPRVAVALAVVLLGSGATTGLLKPLLGGARVRRCRRLPGGEHVDAGDDRRPVDV